MSRKHRILVVDDEINMRDSIREILMDAGFECEVSEDGAKALEIMSKTDFDLVVSDIKMPNMSGIELLHAVKKEFPGSPLLLITAFSTVKQAVEVIKAGAEDYITKPFDPDDLIEMIKALLNRKNNLSINQNDQIIGRSEQVEKIYQLVERVAPTDSTVLIEGESGTGKELVANAIYNRSNRNKKPFVKVNCAAIPSTLMESELFGHVKGSFTGAVKDKKGKFELANNGTIYLDEIGDMDISLQAKILRVLQEKEFSRVGSESVKKLDIRFIAATNKDLKEAIGNCEFREDLYYRLNVINIKIPPLRERKDDISPLIDHFIEKFNKSFQRNIQGITDEARELLVNYQWPGNIRELENSIERAIILSHADVLDKNSFSDQVTSTYFHSELSSVSFQKSKVSFEKKLLEDALNKSNGKVTVAANLLGITRHSLRYQMEKFGLKNNA